MLHILRYLDDASGSLFRCNSVIAVKFGTIEMGMGALERPDVIGHLKSSI